MRMRQLIVFIVALFMCVPAVAQKKELSQARAYIKKGQNLDKAENSMRLLLKDSTNLQNSRIWLTLYESVQAQYNQQNQKLYQKQKADTLSLMQNCRKMFIVVADMQPYDSIQSQKLFSELLPLRQNIYSGGMYFLRHQKWADALTYFDHYLQLSPDSNIPEAAYGAMFAAHKMGNAQRTIEFSELAQQDTVHYASVLQLSSNAYLSLGDTTNYERILKQGITTTQEASFFIPRLLKLYVNTNRPDEAMKLADESMLRDSTNAHYPLVKAQLYYDSEDYEQAIRWAKKSIELSDTLAQTYYTIGMSILGKITLIDKQHQTRQSRKRIRTLYEEALPYMEQYRKLRPKDSRRWAMPLYRIYLNLNRGKEFEEMERILTKQGNMS